MLVPEKFGLSRSPFSLVPEQDVLFWAGLPETKTALQDVMSSVRDDDIGSSEFVILNGDLGAGKSHALRYFARQVREDGGLAIYLDDIVAAKKPSFGALVHKMSDSLEASGSQELIGSVRQAINSQEPYDKDRAEIIQELVPRTELEAFNKLLNGIIPNPGGSDDYNVVRWLAQIFQIATMRIGDRAPAFRATYLFLDEVEFIADLTATVQVPFFGSLRSLINALPNNFALVLSFSLPTGVLEAVVPQSLWERRTRGTIQIEQMTTLQAEQFVKEYLDHVRPAGVGDFPQPFYPFSEEAIASILEEETSLVPRRILRYLGRVWERVARRELLAEGEEISRETADKILEAVR